eukprot:scaffold33172_cov29-Attheya_sp.AAC.2
MQHIPSANSSSRSPILPKNRRRYRHYHIPFIDKVHPESPWLPVLSPNARHNMWIVTINEEQLIMALLFIEYIRTLQHPTDTVTATLILAKRISTGGTNFQELRASFDQMRPCISHFVSLVSKPQDQTNIGSALKSSERHHWKSACFSQYYKNSEANLFSKPLPSRNAKRGIDYVESYAPVTTTACSIRIIVALAAGHTMTLAIADVKNAFQNTMIPVGERAHVTMPPYYLQWFRRKHPNIKITSLEAEADKYCLQSMNAIQGTKSAWNNILTNVLQVHKYKQNHIDHAVFIYCSPDKTETQSVCVSPTDDFSCAFTHQHLFYHLCTSLRKYFELTTKEGPKLSYLNLNIEQHPTYISINQTAHIQEIVDAWFPDSTNLHTTDTPFRTDSEFEKAFI